MIVLPSTSAGFQSSSLVGLSSITINSPFSIATFTLKANTSLTIANIVGANPSWVDMFNYGDYVTFWQDRSFNSYYLQGVYGDDGAGNISWLDISTFTDCSNTIVPSNYNTMTIQLYVANQTIPLLNGNLAINLSIN
jgi:hypothetical protein